MWQLALIDCLSPFHLQKYSPLVGSYILIWLIIFYQSAAIYRWVLRLMEPNYD